MLIERREVNAPGIRRPPGSAARMSPKDDPMNNGFNNAADRPQRGHRAPPCAMVIFGASGDLTRRLLMPALYNLVRARRIPNNFAIIGVDRTEWAEDRFRLLRSAVSRWTTQANSFTQALML